MKAIEKTLKYYELLLVCNDLNKTTFPLPKGYSWQFYQTEADIEDWVDIHLSSEEFASKTRAKETFFTFYDKFIQELPQRCFFITYNNQKIATATISPANEYGYNCVIDWLAIKKEFQGKGLGKPLISKCLEVAKKLGYDKLLLHTQTHTWLAAKLYLDLGFDPLNIKSSLKGWQILKTITSHPKLNDIKAIPEKDLYDKLALNIVKQLSKLHNNYAYEIWYKFGQNDVYVNENNNFFHYKFYKNGKELKLCDKLDK